MAFHNANYKAITLTGTMGPGMLGDGISAATIHQIFCIAAGSIEINAMGGGQFTWPALAGQKIDVLASKVNVLGGEFVGFKAKFQARQFPMQGQ